MKFMSITAIKYKNLKCQPLSENVRNIKIPNKVSIFHSLRL